MKPTGADLGASQDAIAGEIALAGLAGSRDLMRSWAREGVANPATSVTPNPNCLEADSVLPDLRHVTNRSPPSTRSGRFGVREPQPRPLCHDDVALALVAPERLSEGRPRLIHLASECEDVGKV